MLRGQGVNVIPPIGTPQRLFCEKPVVFQRKREGEREKKRDRNMLLTAHRFSLLGGGVPSTACRHTILEPHSQD